METPTVTTPLPAPAGLDALAPVAPAQTLPPKQATARPWWNWPRLWEQSLAFILGICVVIVLQSSWKLLQSPLQLLPSASSIDINQADVKALKQLPGVGPNLAARIVDHRTRNGPFARVDDLKAVHGIGPTTVERLRYLVMVSTSGESASPSQPMQPMRSGPKSKPSEPIDLNSATAQQLMSLPGIGPALAERIIEDRDTNGSFPSVNDLTRIRGIKSKTVEKLAPFVVAGKAEKGV